MTDDEILESQKHLLLQEIYCDDPWKMLICCIFLNQTNRKQVDGIRLEFFKRYPDMFEVKRADPIEMADLLKSLGFRNKRTKIIKRFSIEWMSKSWEEPNELYGIGEYGQDSWEIFQKGNTNIDPRDGVLKKYLECFNEFKENLPSGSV